ncbi:hypothetical protein HMPREF9056_02112 [Actinomyces sp. oral taxon 170 str. F0386]|nr:hypothetical protein HMPREF9056_02112 [Actinomyces sp. oral taxon 170 str. F0386]
MPATPCVKLMESEKIHHHAVAYCGRPRDGDVLRSSHVPLFQS